MNNRKWIWWLLTFLGGMQAVAEAQRGDERPNIMLIMADDLSMYDTQPYGSSQVYTPHLVALQQQSVCFDNMFNMVPICAPTRQTLLTGLGPVRNGAYPNHSIIYNGIKTLPVYLQQLGYKTALIGKRHYGPLASYPFDFLGGRDHDEGKGKDIDLSKAETYISATGSQPFFLMFASNQPHTPWNRGNRNRYQPLQLSLSPNMVDTRLTRERMADYFAEISYLDSLVGYCLDMIERSGKARNTIVIFASEQGNSFPFSKWTLYDQGLRSAFIVKWPGKIAPGTRNSAMVQYTDILPTLIDIAGGTIKGINTGSIDAFGNAGFDGSSFKAVLLGNQIGFRDCVFGVNTTRGINNGSDAYASRSVRDTQYLYIENLNYQNSFSNVVTASPLFAQWLAVNKHRAMQYTRRPEFELYDIRKDPWQLNNLADSIGFAPVVTTMQKKLHAFMQQQGDKGVATEMEALSRQPRGEAHD